MSSVSLQPLLTKRAINPEEFWPSYHNIATKISHLFGSMNNLEKIPVFPLDDLQGNFDSLKLCDYVFSLKVKKLDYPIAFFFDSTGGYAGIVLAYRIKSIQIPKFSCLRGSIKRDIEMIYISPTERDSYSLSVNPVIGKFGPASALHCQREPFNSNECTPLLQKLLNGETYQVQQQSPPSCLYTQQARIELDQDE